MVLMMVDSDLAAQAARELQCGRPADDPPVGNQPYGATMRLTNSAAFSCTTFSEASAASEGFSRDVAIVGGCGRVGLPLGVALASRGLRVTLYDINAASVEVVNSGRLPFDEPGAADRLTRAVADGTLRATT